MTGFEELVFLEMAERDATSFDKSREETRLYFIFADMDAERVNIVQAGIESHTPRQWVTFASSTTSLLISHDGACREAFICRTLVYRLPRSHLKSYRQQYLTTLYEVLPLPNPSCPVFPPSVLLALSVTATVPGRI